MTLQKHDMKKARRTGLDTPHNEKNEKDKRIEKEENGNIKRNTERNEKQKGNKQAETEGYSHTDCKSKKTAATDLRALSGIHEKSVQCTIDESFKRKQEAAEETSKKKSKITLDEICKNEEATENDTKTNGNINVSLQIDLKSYIRQNLPEGKCNEKSATMEKALGIEKEMSVTISEKTNSQKIGHGDGSNSNNNNTNISNDNIINTTNTTTTSTTNNNNNMNYANKDSVEKTLNIIASSNSKTKEEKEAKQIDKEETGTVCVKTGTEESGKAKEESQRKNYENSRNEEHNKYHQALQYNNFSHKYTRSPFVSFSNKYKDSSIRLSDDQLTCYGDKGWASVFLNCGADDGKWYFEITVESSIVDLNFLGYTEKKLKINSCLRVGYACRYMRYDHPIGTNKYSYCVSSKDGKMFNSSISYNCMKAFGKGDVIGCYMNLKKKTNYNFDPRLDKKLYEYIQNGILCDPQDPPQLAKSEGSLIFFSLNGEIKEHAFVDIYDGFYHPSVSLYMGATARINLGPNFKYNYLKDYVPCLYMHPPVVT